MKDTNKVNEVKLGLLAGKRSFRELRSSLVQLNEIDIANFLNLLPVADAFIIFRLLPKNIAASVFAELFPETQIKIVEAIKDSEITSLIDELAVDDAVDMLEEMPAQLVQRVLKNSSKTTRRLLNEYLKYDSDSVGGIMTPEFLSIRQNMTVKEVIEYIRKTGENKETIYICYILDSFERLIGVTTVRDLLSANDSDLVEDVMQSSNLISVTPNTPQEEATNLIRKYRLIALPVVDEDFKMLGIVTVDDALDVIQEEATEDIEKMAGIAPSEKPYLKSSSFELAKNRFFWLFILMLSGIVSEIILSRFEGYISSIPLLVAFIPLLTDMGGDAGSQVSALVIRGMALEEIIGGEMPITIAKEVIVSLFVGIPLAAINFARIMMFNPDQPIVALTISLTLICTILMANVLGVILPFIAKKLRLDPALMATPMIATLVDILSMVIYIAIAITLLPI